MKSLLLFLTITLFTFSTHALSQKDIRIVPTKKLVTIEIDGNFPAGPETDVLFVIDDSGSMNSHQKNLAAHIDLFAEQATKAANHFHIGVINTRFRNDVFEQGNEIGELMGSPKVITPSTPNLVQALRDSLLLGVQGSGTESVFSPVLAALSEESLKGMNAGFYRENAHLSVIALTDAEDQSNISAWDFVDSLVDLKGSFQKVSMQAVMVSVEEFETKSCPGDQEPATKLEEAVRLLQGEQFSLCSTQMAQDIETLAKNVFPPFQGEFKPGVTFDSLELVGNPEVATIKVQFGTQTLLMDNSTGWTYDEASNQIIFGSQIEWQPQPQDTQVVITYRPQ